MDAIVLKHEVAIRLGSFLGIFALIAVWELWAPRRVLSTSKASRWLSNLGVAMLDSGLVRWVLPILAVGMALLAGERDWGLLNNVELPYWLAVCVGVVLLDCVIYLQHVMFHAVPVLWRLHMVHHSDLDFDVTTGLRFHPVESAISMGIKLAAVVVFGPPTLAVLVFEILLNGASMFNHGNIRITARVDRALRLIVVTPDMHRVHHSVLTRETNSNFGFNLPWWDRLFATYRAQPVKGHEAMKIGLAQFREPKRLTLPWMLAMPFIGKPGQYPITRPTGGP